jgi:hypothetical protein
MDIVNKVLGFLTRKNRIRSEALTHFADLTDYPNFQGVVAVSDFNLEWLDLINANLYELERIATF